MMHSRGRPSANSRSADGFTARRHSCVIVHRVGVPLGSFGGLSIAISWSIAGRDASGFAREPEPLQGST